MGGVTPHGIRYPDGASKAKNLGPELKTMAEDIDWYIGSYLSPTGPIRQIIIGVAEEVVPPIVQEEIDRRHLVEGGVDEGPRTNLDHVALRWMHSEISDPYSDTYASEYVGNRVDTQRQWGHVPILTGAGRIPSDQIPLDVVRMDDDGHIAEEVIPDSIARKSDIPSPGEGGGSGGSSLLAPVPGIPALEARLTLAKLTDAPVAVVFAGSSTTAATGGYVVRLTALLQERRWGTAAATPVQFSPDAEFTARTAAGIHSYSAGQNGARAETYLTNDERDRIAALNPAAIVHMVGANDYVISPPPGSDPVGYEATMRASLAAFDSRLTAPCQHVLIHSYAKLSNPNPVWPWSEYLAALENIARDRDDVVVIDLSKEFRVLGVDKGGADPFDLISEDGTHMTAAGNRVMADRLIEYFTP